MYAVLQSSNKKDTKTYILLTGSQQPVLKPQILNFLLENLLVYFFFRKKLQIVFLCKLNSYTYFVYFDSCNINSFWSDWNKYEENFNQNCVKWYVVFWPFDFEQIIFCLRITKTLLMEQNIFCFKVYYSMPDCSFFSV
jgi:hypothetical protein